MTKSIFDFEQAIRFARKIRGYSHMQSTLHDIAVEQYRAGEGDGTRQTVLLQFELMPRWKKRFENFDAKCYEIQKCIGLLFELNDEPLLREAFAFYEESLDRIKREVEPDEDSPGRAKRFFKRFKYCCELAPWFHRLGDTAEQDRVLLKAQSFFDDIRSPKLQAKAVDLFQKSCAVCERHELSKSLHFEAIEKKKKARAPSVSDEERLKTLLDHFDFEAAEKLVVDRDFSPYQKSWFAVNSAAKLIQNGEPNQAGAMLDKYLCRDDDDGGVFNAFAALFYHKLGRVDYARKMLADSKSLEFMSYDQQFCRIGFFQNWLGFHDDALATARFVVEHISRQSSRSGRIQDSRYPLTLFLILGVKEEAAQIVDESLGMLKDMDGSQNGFDYEYCALAQGISGAGDIRRLGISRQKSLGLFGYDPLAGFSIGYEQFEENRIPL